MLLASIRNPLKQGMCDTLCDSQKSYSRVKLRIPTRKDTPMGQMLLDFKKTGKPSVFVVVFT